MKLENQLTLTRMIRAKKLTVVNLTKLADAIHHNEIILDEIAIHNVEIGILKEIVLSEHDSTKA